MLLLDRVGVSTRPEHANMLSASLPCPQDGGFPKSWVGHRNLRKGTTVNCSYCRTSKTSAARHSGFLDHGGPFSGLLVVVSTAAPNCTIGLVLYQLVCRNDCPICLRGGRNCRPSPGPAGPPPRDVIAGQDFAFRLSRKDWFLGGGLAHRVEFICLLQK